MPMWTGLGFIMELCGDRPATNHLRQGAVPQCTKMVHINVPEFWIFHCFYHWIISSYFRQTFSRMNTILLWTDTDTQHITPTVHTPVMVMILQLRSLPVANGTSCIIHCYCRTALMVVSYETKINVTWDMTPHWWASTSWYFEQL